MKKMISKNLNQIKINYSHVETVDISEQHLAVQFDTALHRQTCVYVAAILGAL